MVEGQKKNHLENLLIYVQATLYEEKTIDKEEQGNNETHNNTYQLSLTPNESSS